MAGVREVGRLSHCQCRLRRAAHRLTWRPRSGIHEPVLPIHRTALITLQALCVCFQCFVRQYEQASVYTHGRPEKTSKPSFGADIRRDKMAGCLGYVLVPLLVGRL